MVTSPSKGGGGQCNSHKSATSSFTGECASALAITTLLCILQRSFHIEPTAGYVVLIDNKSVVDKINDLDLDRDLHPMDPEYNMFSLLRNNLTTLKIKGEWHWIRSHQRSEHPFVILNNQVDELAKQYWARNNCPHMCYNYIHHVELQVINTPVNSKYLEVLHSQYADEDMKIYIGMKCNLTDDQMKNIDWDTFSSAISILAEGKRIQVLKLIFGWQNTGIQKQ